MRDYLDIIVNTGISSNSSRIEQREVILSNKISLLLIPFTIIAIILSNSLGASAVLIGALIVLTLLFSVFGLNRVRLNLLARILVSLIPLIAVYYQELNHHSILYLYVGLVVLPLVLFLKKTERVILYTILTVHLSILVYSIFFRSTAPSELMILLLSPLILWVLIVSFVQFLKTENNIIQHHLQNSNDALTSSHAEIKLQKEEIQTQNEFLNVKQIKIEEQSANLLRSNNELRNTKVEMLKMIDRLEEAKENLKRKEAEAASILKALDNHYIVAQLNLEGRLVQINHKVTDLFGEFEPEMMKVKGLLDQHDNLSSNGRETSSLKALWPKILRGHALSMDIEIPFKETSKYFSTTLAPLFDPNGKPYRVLAIGQDISELYDKKEKIDAINQELKGKIDEISQQNQLLNFQQLEIFNKNEELKNQSEEIRSINESLEIRVRERTQVLEEKNKQLSEYAFINSHVLRAPVSTMMGLINLISYSAIPVQDQKIYDHLLETANVLDTIVFKINNAIDNGAHFDRNYLEPERDFEPMNLKKA